MIDPEEVVGCDLLLVARALGGSEGTGQLLASAVETTRGRSLEEGDGGADANW